MIEVRPARIEDDVLLARIDASMWSAVVSPAGRPGVGTRFFGERTRPGDVLVAEVDGIVAGYAKLRQTIPLPSHEHVLELSGTGC